MCKPTWMKSEGWLPDKKAPVVSGGGNEVMCQSHIHHYVE